MFDKSSRFFFLFRGGGGGGGHILDSPNKLVEFYLAYIITYICISINCLTEIINILCNDLGPSHTLMTDPSFSTYLVYHVNAGRDCKRPNNFGELFMAIAQFGKYMEQKC